MTETLIRLPQVRARTGLSKTEIYRRAKSGEFPSPRRLSHKVSVWQASEVEAWIVRTLDPEAADLI